MYVTAVHSAQYDFLDLKSPYGLSPGGSRGTLQPESTKSGRISGHTRHMYNLGSTVVMPSLSTALSSTDGSPGFPPLTLGSMWPHV
jgi:hypothetical protein